VGDRHRSPAGWLVSIANAVSLTVHGSVFRAGAHRGWSSCRLIDAITSSFAFVRRQFFGDFFVSAIRVLAWVVLVYFDRGPRSLPRSYFSWSSVGGPLGPELIGDGGGRRVRRSDESSPLHFSTRAVGCLCYSSDRRIRGWRHSIWSCRRANPPAGPTVTVIHRLPLLTRAGVKTIRRLARIDVDRETAARVLRNRNSTNHRSKGSGDASSHECFSRIGSTVCWNRALRTRLVFSNRHRAAHPVCLLGGDR